AKFATMNLANAIKNLPKFHEAIRPLLTPFYNSKALDKLDKHERDQFSRVWAMWYFFAAHPNKVMQNAAAECVGQPLALIRKIRLRLRDALRGLSSERI